MRKAGHQLRNQVSWTVDCEVDASLAHEATTVAFFSEVLPLFRPYLALGWGYRATRFHVPGQGSKEADAGIRLGRKKG